MEVKLTKECLHTISSYLNYVDTLSLMQTNSTLRNSFADSYYWDEWLDHSIVPLKHRGKYRLNNVRNVINSMFRCIIHEELNNITSAVISASSMDRSVEGPQNIFRPSACLRSLKEYQIQYRELKGDHRLGYFAQRTCGCIGESTCYWSSAPTPRQDRLEYVTFKLVKEVSIVVGFSITPYQAFFHPNAPVYGPIEACIQLLPTSSTPPLAAATVITTAVAGGGSGTETYSIQALTETQLSENVYFQSEFQPIENVFEEQFFFLLAPVLAVQSVARIVLRGMHTKQSLGPGTIEEYYLCLSHCSVLSAAVEQYVGALSTIPRSSTGTSTTTDTAAGATAAPTVALQKYEIEVEDEDFLVCEEFQSIHCPQPHTECSAHTKHTAAASNSSSTDSTCRMH